MRRFLRRDGAGAHAAPDRPAMIAGAGADRPLRLCDGSRAVGFEL